MNWSGTPQKQFIILHATTQKKNTNVLYCEKLHGFSVTFILL